MFKVRWKIWQESCCKLTAESTVKKFLKSANISQSYERISSGTFFIAHGVLYKIFMSILIHRKWQRNTKEIKKDTNKQYTMYTRQIEGNKNVCDLTNTTKCDIILTHTTLFTNLVVQNREKRTLN